MSLETFARGCVALMGIAFGIAGGVTGRGGFAIACAICLVGVLAIAAREERR